MPISQEFNESFGEIPVLLVRALHVLFIQLSNGVHQGRIIGMSAGAQVVPGTIQVVLRLLLSLQDVLLHGVLQQLVDLIQEGCPQNQTVIWFHPVPPAFVRNEKETKWFAGEEMDQHSVAMNDGTIEYNNPMSFKLSKQC